MFMFPIFGGHQQQQWDNQFIEMMLKDKQIMVVISFYIGATRRHRPGKMQESNNSD